MRQSSAEYSNDQPLAKILNLQNITERKNAEIRLQKYAGDLEKANALKESSEAENKLVSEKEEPEGQQAKYVLPEARWQRILTGLINDYRIREAELQLSKNNKKLTMEAIALECGFSSKSAFYAAFRKKKGKTPTEFLNYPGLHCF